MDDKLSPKLKTSLVSDWKICNDNFKVPLKVSPRPTLAIAHKSDIVSIVAEELMKSSKVFKNSIHELNFLQSGQNFVHYKKENETDENLSEEPASKRYFIDDSDDSDNEYFDSEEIINRIVAEQKIVERVQQLKKQDCWSLKMLSKHADPPRPEFHWDLLIKEMKWMHSTIATGRQNKRIDARKLATAAAKYIKEKEAQTEKQDKEATVKAKKHCAMIAKSIRDWWKQMEKIVKAKHKFRLDAKRQEAMNTHLGKVLETTEKYMEWLTEDINGTTSGDNDGSVEDDPDFQINDDVLVETDDEETIEKEEDEVHYDVEEEIEALKKEHEKTLEDILKELPEDYFDLKHEVKKTDNVDENSANVVDVKVKRLKRRKKKDSEFNVSDTSEDFEETMEEQETFEIDVKMSGDECEIKELENDANMPIDDLIKMYRDMYSVIEPKKEDKENKKEDVTDDDNNNDSDSALSTDSSDSSSSDSKESSYESSIDLGVELEIERSELPTEDSYQLQGQFQEISEVALSTQPKGFTLESTEVKVQVPDLLKGTLREYQHVGLDWLAAIYEKRLNGVLADEMGLGKTIQTIALLAYMACEKSIWGPHLVVVPTSVVLNWEIEFKKWCPGFKILTYFGSFKERKEKRKGWTKTNAFHVCITSYKLAIQDCAAFKRKKWKYMILDEAQNIKNFKSQRWQTLLTFNSQRRLLLTGTPLQNNLMELWSLMHFLMPNIFQSHREFNEWFGTPLSGMIEGSKEYNEQLILRLHKVLRPFILRRLKKDVEKQMPQKYNHIVMCQLSKRQRFLYDDYMSMSSTSETLASGQFLSVLNILMQLRKVCNHPNLFEERPTLSPFSMSSEDSITYNYPKMLLIDTVYQHRHSNGRHVMFAGTSSLADLALNLPKFVSERIFGLTVKPKLIEEVDHITTADWVSKYKVKNPLCHALSSAFIPRDLVDYLNNSEPSTTSLPVVPIPQCHGLMVRRCHTDDKDNQLPQIIVVRRRQQRYSRLKTIAQRNAIRCAHVSTIGPDIISLLSIINRDSFTDGIWNRISYDILRLRPLDQFINDSFHIVQRVNFVNPTVMSRGVILNTASFSLNQLQHTSERLFAHHISDIPDCLVSIRQKQLVQFPETSLIEYDCGKLQVLVQLLATLKSGGHRCLIFTQMTRMLDILEQFLSYHGYKYLRLDGTTKIEQRQVMMEQFNKDEKIFVFILSTRSGGIGVNLTGADTVIFYDSDWNPTMDAQAQDRCHRIGQTRDVHIYRLISKMTIEENILKKANEKRHLNEMAIEGGQFNMSFFKNNTLQDIFESPSGLDDLNVENSPTDKTPVYTSSRGRVVKWKGGKTLVTARSFNDLQDSELKPPNVDTSQFEAALEEIEDENDRLAANITKAEVKADLLEFDESVPWEDTEEGASKVDVDENKFRQEMESHLANFNSQLNPIQRFGVGMLEHSLGDLLFDELEREETHIENSKQTWHLDQIKALHEDQEEMKEMEEDDMMYIYGKYDPYAAQKEELEKLRREEEFQLLEDLRRDEEIAQLEKDKAAAQIWAQEQHMSASKRKYCELSDDEGSLGTNSESLPRRCKERKVVVARFEMPDEAITNTSQIMDSDQPPISSSSSSIINEPRPFPAKRRTGRPCWKNLPTNSRNSHITKPLPSSLPSKKRSAHTTISTLPSLKSPLSKRNNHVDQHATSKSIVTDIPRQLVRDNTPKQNGYHKTSDHHTVNPSPSSTLATPAHLQYVDPPIIIPGIKKRRGRPSNDVVPNNQDSLKTCELPRPPTQTDSVVNVNSKKNSFKIPVKTLSGERKLFSAPLLLMKTKPVFIITRKIEDSEGNVYTQNLTYPIISSDRFNEISSSLTKFASNPNEKC